MTTPVALGLMASLRAEIIAGDLHPGERLNERELAARFQESRTAVRDALLMLESEGLVAREFHRGARVRIITPEEAIQMLETRAVLDGFCAGLAAQRLTAADREELVALADQMREAAANDESDYARIAQQLHVWIRRHAQHTVINEILERLQYQNIRHQFSVGLFPDRSATEAAEHLRIVDAILDGDAEAAERLMRTHFVELVELLRDKLSQQEAARALVRRTAKRGHPNAARPS